MSKRIRTRTDSTRSVSARERTLTRKSARALKHSGRVS
jgi:hypothetical protein